MERLKKRHGHFADVVVVDALYMDAPFINTLKENGLEAVIRLKDETRLLFQDAEGLFNKDEGRKESFQKGKKTVKVWDLSGFEIEKRLYKLRVVRYQESWEEKGRNTQRWMWLVTTMEQADYRILWEIMNHRWDIEENVFSSVKNVLPCKALLLPYGSGSCLYPDAHRIQYERAIFISEEQEF